MSDIVKQLRGKEPFTCNANFQEALACDEGDCKCEHRLQQGAADEIERLREALRQIAKCDLQAWALGALDKNSDDQRQALERIAQYDMRKIAIDALGEGKE